MCGMHCRRNQENQSGGYWGSQATDGVAWTRGWWWDWGEGADFWIDSEDRLDWTYGGAGYWVWGKENSPGGPKVFFYIYSWEEVLSFTQACARHRRCRDEQDTISAFKELTVYYFRFLDFEGQVQSAVKWVRRGLFCISDLGEVLVLVWVWRENKSSLDAESRKEYSRRWAQQGLSGLWEW